MVARTAAARKQAAVVAHTAAARKQAAVVVHTAAARKQAAVVVHTAAARKQAAPPPLGLERPATQQQLKQRAARSWTVQRVLGQLPTPLRL